MAMLKLVRTVRYGSSRSTSWSNSWSISNYQMTSACSTSVFASKPTAKKMTTKKRFPVSSANGKKSAKDVEVNLVFDSLAKGEESKYKEIKNAKTMEELLTISEIQNISHKNITHIITTINHWVAIKKISLKDFEKDPRFLNICTLYIHKGRREPASTQARKTVFQKNNPSKHVKVDLPEITDPFADVSKLTTSQTVKLMSGLAAKRKRLTPLLRNVTGHISSNIESLTFKENADVLYCMATLNFPNDILLQKICKEILNSLNTINQSPIIGSIVTSLGMLRYRNDGLMNELSEWAVKNKQILRIQDLCAFLMTLATIGFKPFNSEVFFKELIAPLKETDMINSAAWLDVVWALTVLNQVTPTHLESVLNNRFISILADPEDIPTVKKYKLQNINAAAKLLTPNYTGSLLEDNSSVFGTPIVRSKEEQVFLRSITDALANLFPSRDHFQMNVDSRTGFVLDVEFYFNKNKGPILISDRPTQKETIRIGIVANSYHDYCIGEINLLGSILLHYRLLEAQNYLILDISHTYFLTDDNLLKRITYINDRIKSIVK